MTAPRPLSVVFLMRAPQERSFSIEAVFETVRAHLPSDIAARVVTSAYPSRGFWPRLKGMFHARRACKGADVIHMTGDAHFLVFLLPRNRVVLTFMIANSLCAVRGSNGLFCGYSGFGCQRGVCVQSPWFHKKANASYCNGCALIQSG